jgi:putative flavoprotein involved in K+ transport
MKTHYPVVVVGGGQAGLSISYLLRARGIDHAVLEKNRIAHSWRSERWDNFCLVTPNWQCRLPGHAYNGPDPHGFMGKDAIVGYVESYARAFDPPLFEGVRVTALLRRPQKASGFELVTSAGTLAADQVVVATGSYHHPRIEGMAAGLPASVKQLHSSQYRSPAALPAGSVLVVGTGQSGAQIAEDLQLAGRKVHLAVGSAPRCARRHRGKDVVEWLDQMGYYDIPIDRHPNREQVRDKTNHYVTGRDGGRDIDLRQFAREGMELHGSLRSIRAGQLEFAGDLRHNLDAADAVYASINRTIDAFIEQCGIDAPPGIDYQPVWRPEREAQSLDVEGAEIAAVIWCSGFTADFSWIDLPVLDARGYPRHERGVSDVPGVYFLGLPWLYTWGSGRFSGVGRDAEHLADRIHELAFNAGAGYRAASSGS